LILGDFSSTSSAKETVGGGESDDSVLRLLIIDIGEVCLKGTTLGESVSVAGKYVT
jgi:hypothetical protein